MDKKILKLAYDEFRDKKPKFDKMDEYYRGNTDEFKEYIEKESGSRNNYAIHANFLQMFVNEEVSYSLGNDIKYISKTNNDELVDEIESRYLKLSRSHDINLLEKMLISSIAYELYYIDRDGDFNARVISASSGMAFLDDYGELEFFMHVYKKKFEDAVFVDVYDDRYIYTYNDDFKTLISKGRHNFSKVPVGIATWDKEDDNTHKTIYGNIKSLQAAYSRNLSDASNEISDLKSAYLVFKGITLEDDQVDDMRREGVMELPDGSSVDWLLKNLDGTQFEPTLTRYKNDMFTLTKHIDLNQAISASTSSLAIQERFKGLDEKAKSNQKAISDCIHTRVEMLFDYLSKFKTNSDRFSDEERKRESDKYDSNDIKIVFSSNLPSDDSLTADTINKLGDLISQETALSLLSFVDSPVEEMERKNVERQEEYEGLSLLDELPEDLLSMIGEESE